MVHGFHFRDCQISGVHLIEASAGTGKTFTITRLFLRLILEGYSASEILILSFTNAATQELQERIRKLLQQCLQENQVLKLQGEGQDASRLKKEEGQDISQLLQNYKTEESARYLRKALENFDDINIHTIHAFCRHILSEQAFVSQTLPNVQLSGSASQEKSLVQDAVLYFWRKYIQNSHPIFLKFLMDIDCSFVKLLEFARGFKATYKIGAQCKLPLETLEHQKLRVRLEKARSLADGIRHKDVKQSIEAYREHENYLEKEYQEKSQSLYLQIKDFEDKYFHPMKEKWLKPQVSARSYLEVLIKKARQKKTKQKKDPYGKTLIEELDEHFSKSHFSLLSPRNASKGSRTQEESFEMLSDIIANFDITKEEWVSHEASCQDGGSGLGLGFHNMWSSYLAEYFKLLNALSEHFMLVFYLFTEIYPQRLKEKKLSSGVQFYDDLLVFVHQALYSSKNKERNELLQRLRRKYRVAMIDEFQDTDRMQCEIFTKIFDPKCSEDKNQALFLIGDPKQSIYSFRGGDIQAYQEIKEGAVDQISYLSYNYRSSPELLDAIHAIYTACPSPFASEKLKYQLTNSAYQQINRVHTQLHMHSKEASSAALHFKVLENHRLNTKQAQELISHALTYDIMKLLASGGTQQLLYKNKAVSAKDIAILTSTKSEAKMIRDTLRSHGIPAILSIGENIYESIEAKELQLILEVVYAKQYGKKLKAALASIIWGYTAKEIKQCFEDEAMHTELRLRIQEYHDIWLNEGFSAMFQVFLSKEKILEKHLRYQEGESLVNNLLHLGELIYPQDTLEAQQILKNLKENIEQKKQQLSNHEMEAEQLRLIDSRDTVKIMTIHKSKGLEFPIVFCPYLYQINVTGLKIGRHLKYYSQMNTEKDDSYEKFEFPSFFNNLTASPVLGDIFYFKTKGADNPEAIKKKAKYEMFEESLRLIYVALTRASERLYIYWVDSSKDSKVAIKTKATKKDKKTSGAKLLPAHYLFSADQPDIPIWEWKAQWQRSHQENYRKQNRKEPRLKIDLEKIDIEALKKELAKARLTPSQKAQITIAQPTVSIRKLHPSRSLHSFTSLHHTWETRRPDSAIPIKEDYSFNTFNLEHSTDKRQSSVPGLDATELKETPGSTLDKEGRGATNAHNIAEHAPFPSPFLGANRKASDSELEFPLQFPKGAKAGTFLHEVLENIHDFSHFLSHIEQREYREKFQKELEARLEQHGYLKIWSEGIISYLKNLFAYPLYVDDTYFFKLAQIHTKKSKKEMAFWLHLSLDLLPQRLVENNAPSLNDTQSLERYPDIFNPLVCKERAEQYFLHGYIDYVFEFNGRFYIIDWKSNFLGESMSDYQAHCIEKNIIDSGYRLQYYIYTLALDQLLRAQIQGYDYSKHFGGIFYIYLRGIDPGYVSTENPKTTGVYFNKPDLEQIRLFEQSYIQSKVL